MSTYTIEVEVQTDKEVLLKVSFSEQADNTQIVVDAKVAIEALGLQGGRLVKFNGAASLPVAMVMCHAVAHLFGAVAVYDPKLAGYVVCVSHSPEHRVGELID